MICKSNNDNSLKRLGQLGFLLFKRGYDPVAAESPFGELFSHFWPWPGCGPALARPWPGFARLCWPGFGPALAGLWPGFGPALAQHWPGSPSARPHTHWAAPVPGRVLFLLIGRIGRIVRIRFCSLVALVAFGCALDCALWWLGAGRGMH